MEKEINIIEIIRAQRYFQEAFRLLIDRDKRLDMIARSSNIEIQLSSSTSSSNDSKDNDNLAQVEMQHHHRKKNSESQKLN